MDFSCSIIGRCGFCNFMGGIFNPVFETICGLRFHNLRGIPRSGGIHCVITMGRAYTLSPIFTSVPGGVPPLRFVTGMRLFGGPVIN